MPTEPVTEARILDKALCVVVQRRSLDEATTSALVDEVLTAAAETPRLPIVLDLAQVRFAPSVALGSLVRLSTSFKLDGRPIALVGLDPRVRNAIRVTRLHQVLEIHDTLEQFLGSLSRPR